MNQTNPVFRRQQAVFRVLRENRSPAEECRPFRIVCNMIFCELRLSLSYGRGFLIVLRAQNLPPVFRAESDGGKLTADGGERNNGK